MGKQRYVKVLHICVLLIAIHNCREIMGQGQPKRNQQPQKQSSERQLKSNTILKYLNNTEDPCNDFYNFACGNWLKFQEVRGAREGDIVSEAGQLEAKVNRQVQRLLGMPSTARDGYDRPVKDFYRTCTLAQANSPAQKDFVMKFVRSFGGLPDLRNSNWQSNYNWILVIGNLKQKYNLDILISLSIQNLRGNRVYLDEPQTTILPSQFCGAFATQQIEQRDQAIQMDIKNNLKIWFDYGDTDANRIAGDIMSFEYQLCRYMRKDQMVDVLRNEDDPAQLQNQMNARWQENKIHGTRRNINNTPQQLRALESNYRLNLKSYVDVATGNQLTTEVILRSENYFKFLGSLASKGLQASFANYIMYRALSEIMFPLNQRDTDSRSAFCAQRVMQFFPEIAGNLYSNFINDRQQMDRVNIKRDDVRQIFGDIKVAFKTYLDKYMTWMPQTNKRMIQNKVAQLELKEPEYMDNIAAQGLNLYANQNYWQALEAVMMYSANRTFYKLPGQRSNLVEAFGTTIASNPIENQLQIGSALLQLPLYSPNYPKSLKYSGLGVVLAREMVKKYDQQSGQDNPMGGTNRDALTMTAYNQNRECFRSQVSNYFYNAPDVYQNGTQLRDIMADSLAVDIAFLAYLSWLDNGPEGTDLFLETFTDVDYSNTQLFFINFAQSRCAAKQRDPGTPDYYPLDRHTLERLNINIVLGNGNEFGRDFNCVAGTEMNLGDKCLYDTKNDIKGNFQ